MLGSACDSCPSSCSSVLIRSGSVGLLDSGSALSFSALLKWRGSLVCADRSACRSLTLLPSLEVGIGAPGGTVLGLRHHAKIKRYVLFSTVCFRRRKNRNRISDEQSLNFGWPYLPAISDTAQTFSNRLWLGLATPNSTELAQFTTC